MRGQGEGPIQLVIAVIIMGASMYIAFTIYQGMQEGRCASDLKVEMERIQEAMQDVALGYSGTQRTIVISVPRCSNPNVVALSIRRFNDPNYNYCRKCSGAYQECWKIVPIEYDVKNGIARMVDSSEVCIDITGDIDFAVAKSDECKDNLLTEGSTQNACPDVGKFADFQGSCSNNLGNIGLRSNWAENNKIMSFALESRTYKLTLIKGKTQGTKGHEIGQIRICLQDPSKSSQSE